MWPSNLQKSEFLKILYGDLPSLGNIEITDILFSRDGPTIKLSLFTDTLPKNAPEKWKIFNFVSISVQFTGCELKSFSNMRPRGFSEISVLGNRVLVSGAVSMEFTYNFAHIAAIEPQ